MGRWTAVAVIASAITLGGGLIATANEDSSTSGFIAKGSKSAIPPLPEPPAGALDLEALRNFADAVCETSDKRIDAALSLQQWPDGDRTSLAAQLQSVRVQTQLLQEQVGVFEAVQVADGIAASWKRLVDSASALYRSLGATYDSEFGSSEDLLETARTISRSPELTSVEEAARSLGLSRCFAAYSSETPSSTTPSTLDSPAPVEDTPSTTSDVSPSTAPGTTTPPQGPPETG